MLSEPLQQMVGGIDIWLETFQNNNERLKDKPKRQHSINLILAVKIKEILRTKLQCAKYHVEVGMGSELENGN